MAVRLPFARLLLTVFAAVPLLAGIVVGFLGVVVFVAIASVTMQTPGKPWRPRR